MKPSLIYVYDPLCAWCYGFHPIIINIQKRFSDRLTLEVKPGGLAIDDRAAPIRKGYGFTKGTLQQVEKTTGVKFGKNFKLLAEEGSYFYNSEPPCRAQLVVNELSIKEALLFAGRLQKAFFDEGKNLNNPETYPELLEGFDVDTDQFMELFNSQKISENLKKEFEWCRQKGASGFPALLIRIGSEISLMAKGYRPYDTIESHLHHLINNLEKMTT